LVGEYLLIGIDLPALQKLFEVDLDDPMYDAWPVGPKEAAVLRRHVEGPIDLDRYDFFIDCTAAEEDATRLGSAADGSGATFLGR
jgi:hypothetical protein